MDVSKTRFPAAWLLGVAAVAPALVSAEGHEPARAATALASAGIPQPMGFTNFDILSSQSRELDELLKEIAAWVSLELGLPAMQNVPKIGFASPHRMIALGFKGIPSDRRASLTRDVVAIYDDQAGTIFLPQGWTGATAEELSLLVHEMVHHMQNSAGARFGCPEERERQAYEAQQKWLERFGSDLEAAFGIDPMTLLVRTNCFY